jgi:hypothetical protein
LNYIYQLTPVKGKRHEVKERFALPTWKAYDIEQAVFKKFGKYRIQYYPGIEPAFLCIIIKIGISNNPTARVRSINNNYKSGYTEYIELGPIAYLRLVFFIFRKWFYWTILTPAVVIAFVVIAIIIFTL